jgi:hypothetical protein
LIQSKTLTSEEEFDTWEEKKVRGSQIWGIGWILSLFITAVCVN